MNKKETPTEHQLEVLTNSLNCCKRDYLAYRQELLKEIERLEDYKEREIDDLSLEQQELIIADIKIMVDNSKKQLLTGLLDLEKFMKEKKQDLSIKQGKEWKQANKIINDIKEFIEESRDT